MSPRDPLAPEVIAARERMLHLLRREIDDPSVIEAMAAVPRERFVPEASMLSAYDDRALPIGAGQTISQPLMVGLMLDALQLQPGDRALEVGTGSGYAAAVLSRIVYDVVTVERVASLATEARSTLALLGYDNIRVYDAADDTGWPAAAPYDAILVSAGAPHVPRALLAQLARGGRLAIPVGAQSQQQLVRATNTNHGIELMRLGPCAFVPLIGQDAWREGDAGVPGNASVR